MRHFPKGDWKNLTHLRICIASNIKGKLTSVIRDASNLQDAIFTIYNGFNLVRQLLFSLNKYWRCGSAPSLQEKMGKPYRNLFEYLIIDKDVTHVREMCIKWITKGKWLKLERIFMSIFQINSGNNDLEVDQCIDIIFGDFQVLKYFSIDDMWGSKLDLALRNKKAK